jgi:imidazolonepropionase-like amidohydrolase
MSGSTCYAGFRLITGSGDAPRDNASLLVRDGIIVDVNPTMVPGDATRIDLSGKTVMPTIVNPHGHIGYMKGAETDKRHYSRANVIDHLRRLTYYGVSVMQSLGTDREDIEISVRDAQRAGELDDPELAMLLTAGDGIVAPTPGSENGGPFFATDVMIEVRSPDEARKRVCELAHKKPDVIKLWVDDRWGEKAKLTSDICQTVIDEAHRLGLHAIAHIYSLDDAKAAVRAGVDGLAHMVREPGPDQELIDMLVEKDVFVFSSMGVQKGFHESPEWLDDPALAETMTQADRDAFRAQIDALSPEEVDRWAKAYELLEGCLHEFVAGGVKVVLSADTGLFGQFPGFAEHRELEALVQGGMPVDQAIRAATSLPAEILGLSDRGSIAPGKRADLLVLDADPLQDITNTRRISEVIIGGVHIDRDAMRTSWKG